MVCDYKLNLIFNRSKQGIIGINNKLFTSINEDLSHFKEQTKDKVVVMGYNTFTSLPGNKHINILSNRLNVFITNNHYDTLIQEITQNKNKLELLVYKTFDEFYNALINGVLNNKQHYKQQAVL